MAQRAVATQGIERLASFTGNMAALGFVDALDKFDSRQAVDEYARAIGVPPSVVRPDDMVAEMDEQKRQQQMIANATAMASEGANALKGLGSVKTAEPNLATEMLEGAE
jgi:hypothetical protein